MPTPKQQLVAGILELLDSETGALDADQALQIWFMNIKPTGGMRLTLLGFQTLTELEFECWPIRIDDIKDQLKLPQLLALDRKLQNPYYVDYRKRRLVLFGSRDAMMLTLCSDVDGFLRTL